MKEPREIAKMFESEIPCARVDWSQLHKGMTGDEIYAYKYNVFVEKKLIHWKLRGSVSKISSELETNVEIETIEPAIEQKSASIQAMFKVTIHERRDRRKIGNESLSDFCNE